jgi:hypothetical protein
MREPVARAISHYKYSGRFGSTCKVVRRLIRQNVTIIDEHATSLESFVRDEGGPKEKAKWSRTWLWECAKNCYVRWLQETPGYNLTNLAEALEVARRRLEQYHLLIITEKLSDPEYIKGLERMFGEPWNYTTAMPIYCGREAQVLNSRSPPLIRNETVQESAELNWLDTILYEEMTTCPSGIVFPTNDDATYYSSHLLASTW